MASASNIYGMTADEQRSFLAEERESGFIRLEQPKRMFALEFVATGSIAEACKAGGIKSDAGRRWLRDPHIAAFIHYLNQQQEHYSLINASFIETQYLSLLGKLLGEEEVALVDKDGAQFRAKKFDGSGAVAALRDLAKISGHYKEDGTTVNVQVTTLTDAQKKFLDEKLNREY